MQFRRGVNTNFGLFFLGCSLSKIGGERTGSSMSILTSLLSESTGGRGRS